MAKKFDNMIVFSDEYGKKIKTLVAYDVNLLALILNLINVEFKKLQRKIK